MSGKMTNACDAVQCSCCDFVTVASKLIFHSRKRKGACAAEIAQFVIESGVEQSAHRAITEFTMGES